MKKYNVTVNGTTYEVVVEEIGGAPAAASQRPEPKPAKAALPAVAASIPAPSKPAVAAPMPAPFKPTAGPVPSGTGVVKAPMPGTVLSVKVAPGATVKAGDVLLILEAMKMENEITAPKGGTVKEIPVGNGTAVNTDDILVVIE